MKERVKQEDFFVYWKPGVQNMGDCFTKHHPPHHHREICSTYMYKENSLFKFGHNIMQEWVNIVITSIHTVEITPIHTVAITTNRTVLQGCANVVRAY